MSHLELTYRPLSAECVRSTYVLFELVLSISFKSPRLDAVVRYRKVISAGKLKLPNAGRVYQSVSLQQFSLLSPLAHRTKPFLSRRTSKTLRRGHVLRGEFSALIWTISPTARFLQGNVHFCLLWSRGRYSPDHRFQKVSARYCSCLHLRRHKESWF